MVQRGSPQRLIPGNPLAGVLRTAARNGRRNTRRSSPPAPATDEAASVAAPAVQAATAVSDDNGLVMWPFPVHFPAAPAVTATAVATDSPIVATVVVVSPANATVQLWHCDGTPASGATVHLIAVQL